LFSLEKLSLQDSAAPTYNRGEMLIGAEYCSNRQSQGASASGHGFSVTQSGPTLLATHSGELVCKEFPCVFTGRLNPASSGDADDAYGAASGATAWTRIKNEARFATLPAVC